ncbi:polyribonucleotide nucleotidyltransferase [bacterium]|nr:polyribonucleotide nucleotidyltransferase [bacterium]
MDKSEKFELEFPSGEETFLIETGVIAKQAGGAVMLHKGGLTLLCCATATRGPREGIDFFPLMVDFEERFYAAGKFPGGFIKREGRPSETAVLTSRKIDRTLRPLFPDDFRNEVQIIVTALSQDNEQVPASFAICGASCALAISNIPFPKPIAAVRVGYIDKQFVINPTFSQLEESSLNLLASGTRDRINMIEDQSKEVPVDIVVEAVRVAHAEIGRIITKIEELAQARPVEKMDYPVVEGLDPTMIKKIEGLAQQKIEQLIPADSKQDLYGALHDLKQGVADKLLEEDPELDGKQVKEYVGKLVKKYARKKTMEGVRVDSRGYDDIRPIVGMVDFLPRVHGSAMFTRGQTQVLSSVTLGSLSDRQRIDTVNFDSSKRYMHHYNFPPYSVGEVRFMRGASRRDIGHGTLAEKAVVPVLPTEDDFPYSIRVVSEVTESNASSSMASTCGSSMALMAAGVPLTRPVAGISIGMVVEGDEYHMLMDLSGFEDFNGDMDFKVAGTSEGVTAIQLDVKIEGLTLDMVEEALKMAEQGYLKVIEQMKDIIAEPREGISEFAPRLEILQIDVDQIGLIIGPAGKNIKKICADTGAEVDIDEEGKVFVYGTDHAGVDKALSIIKAMTSEIEEGEEYEGTVVSIMPFGAFIEIVPGRDGLLHISNIAEGRIDRVEDVLSVGDTVPVRVREVDQSGKISLLRRDVDYSKKPQGHDSDRGRGRSGPRRDGPGGGRGPQRDSRDRGRSDGARGRNGGGRSDRGGRW